jgi:membrane associated rhomboid family serine protease
MSALFLTGVISVGASGALFGLLGATLSDLLINWTLYASKVSAPAH